MRRMIPQTLIDWVKSIKEMISRSGDKIEIGDSVEIDGDCTVNDELELGESGDIGSNLSNAIATSMIGSFVRIMSAPTSTTLTDAQIAEIIDGRFIDGEFLGYTNPILCTAKIYSESYYYGLLIADFHITCYVINTSTKVISVANRITDINVGVINGKAFPSYPSSTGSFTLKYVDGDLSWVADE